MMTVETLLLKALIVSAVMALASASLAAAGVAVALQQGVKGYTGCTARTILDGRPAEIEQKGILPLRGSKYDFQIRFELPADLAGKTLARARLGVFLPAARKMNSFTEIFCHEVVTRGRQPCVDEVSNYDNGRRVGSVDSVELFSPVAGPGWKRQPYLPLGAAPPKRGEAAPGKLPAGGRWVEFNVTPLVEKWLKGSSANHGVMLMPTDRPDGRYRSTWEIDIPAADYKDAGLRPKLILEFAPLERKYLLGMTDSLRRICDRSSRYAYRGAYGTQYSMSMAGNEFEGFQVVVYPMLADLKNVRFTWTNLKGDDGSAIPAADVEYFLEDSYKLRRNWMTSEVFFGGKLYETADPLVPARPVTIKRHVHTPFYFRVRTRPDTAPGAYRGTITVHAGGVKPARLDLEVKVWPYAIPAKWNFHTMGQFIWDGCARFHGKDWDKKLQRKYYDFLLDHRFSPSEQYASILSPRQDRDYCLKRGMNTVYLSGNFRGTEAEMGRLKKDYGKVKALGALDHALVYIGDETSDWDQMHRRADLAHAHLPGVLVMIGGSFPRKELIGYIDVYDPLIGGGSKVYSLRQERIKLIAESQKRGEEFYWYVACGPGYPYPNVMLDYPLIDSRVLFWLTRKYGVTGFEYYCYNIWERNYCKDPAGRFPNVRWKADGWSRGWPTNCDGMLFYPGPISSLRFEAVRDGIEDWESLQVLRDCVEAIRHRKRARSYRAIIAKAEKLLAVNEEVVKGFKDFTRDPDRLLAERNAVGEVIGRFMQIVPKLEKWNPGAYTLAKAAEVRIARRTAMRRNMLRRRHLKACESLKVRPLSQRQWEGLWPERVLFSQDFDKDGDWDGQIVTGNVPEGSKRALSGHAKNKYHARWIRVGIYWDHARAATTTWVKFKYFLNRKSPIAVMVFDLTKRDNYGGRIDEPVVGRWAEAKLNVTRDFRRKDGSSARMAAGDALDDVFIGAGDPGDKSIQLLVDGVQLIGLD